jgi:transposase
MCSKMVDVEYINKPHKDGWSIRKIARQLEVSRQTVRKVIGAPAEPPRYRRRVPRTAAVTGPYMGVVER